MLPVGEPALCEWRTQSLDFQWKIYVGIFTWIKTSRRKLAKHKAVLKPKGRSQGGRAVRFARWNWLLGCLVTGYLLCVSGPGDAVMFLGGLQGRLLPTILETPPTGCEGEFLTLQGLYLNLHGSLSPWGGGVSPQCKYIKMSPGVSWDRSQEKKACSGPLALGLLVPRS